MAKKKTHPSFSSSNPVVHSSSPVANSFSLFDQRKNRLLSYAGIFILALTVRILSGSGYFFADVDPGYRNFEINDSSYHIRRTEMIMDNYPQVPFFDSYHYYPDSPSVPWPAGYDLFLATLAKPVDWLGGSQLARETFIGLVPCVMDAITVALFLFVFSQFVPFSTALLASFLLSLGTQNVGYSEAGYVDHHYFITFLMALFILGFHFYNKKPNRMNAAILGTLVGSATYFNVSCIQYALLTLLVVAAHAFINRKEKSLLGLPLLVFGFALAASLVASFSTPTGRALKISYDETSLFQFLLIVAVAACYTLASIWIQPASNEKKSIFTNKIILSAVLLCGCVVLLIVTFKNILEGAKFLLVGNILNSVQGEEISVRVYWRLWPVIFTWFLLFFPFGVWRLIHQRKENPVFVILVLLFLGHGLLSGLSHFLYVQFLYPWYALTAALGCLVVLNRLKPNWGAYRFLILAVFIFQVGYVSWAEILNEKNGEEDARDSIKQTIQALAWLRNNSPQTSHHQFGDGLPEYSVFAHRDYGHQIARIAHRPAVISPFSTTAFVDHMRDYVKATLSKDEDFFIDVMKKYNSKYLILDHRDNTMIDFYLGILKDDPQKNMFAANSESKVFLFRNNLLYFDGELRWKKTPGVKHLRLVYEVPKKVEVPLKGPQGLMQHKFNGFKIFERVEGAKVEARGFKPQERVIFRLPLKNQYQARLELHQFWGR
jgi:asparagine N-glycosylation enzyme membrane subunit Stt3